MRQIEILNGATTEDVWHYARSKGYQVFVLYCADDGSYDFNKMLTACLQEANEKKCSEFAVRNFEQGYVVRSDKIVWRISIFAFRER